MWLYKIWQIINLISKRICNRHPYGCFEFDLILYEISQPWLWGNPKNYTKAVNKRIVLNVQKWQKDYGKKITQSSHVLTWQFETSWFMGEKTKGVRNRHYCHGKQNKRWKRSSFPTLVWLAKLSGIHFNIFPSTQ